ncbi:sensor histidine kinase [Hydrogenophaga sp. OTU3427]|uniref:sensor histidine kinase n=1 Tax=Hydrogenophaga sp. OTU3427 TaxID=3043856 RepID=UPI00313C4545
MSASTDATPSLWRHLWWWTLGALLVVWATLIGVAYHTGAHEAAEIADGQLRSVARHWLALPAPLWPGPEDALAGPPQDPGDVVEHLRAARGGEYHSEWALVLWQGGQLRLDSHGIAGRLPALLPPGHRLLTLDGLPGQWRCWVQEGPASEAGGLRRVAVLTPIAAHAALGRDIAEHVARPALVMLPLVALLLAWALRRGLRPLRRLAAQVATLDLRGGHQLPEERRFAELQGAVRAINTLVQNLQDQVRRERGFASDVAHELRTPLTAVVWQARRALGGSAGERDEALRQVEHEALRAGHILSQLLDLARAQGLNPQAMQPVALPALAARVLADHAQAAHEGGHELGLQNDAAGDASVPGHPLMLELALRNLVDNALRHTPTGTQVLVRLWQDASGTGLEVLDDGDGPPPRSTPPAPGHGNLGIGLTLVQRIADVHQASLGPATPIPPYRHGYRLTWPAEPAPPHKD